MSNPATRIRTSATRVAAVVAISASPVLAAPVIGPGATAAAPSPPIDASTICTIEPAANEMPISPALITTVRQVDSQLVVLYTETCGGQFRAWRWLGPDDLAALGGH